MTGSATDQRDFLISFNSADRAWAEWIAYELEKAGYSTVFQHWDFAPGSNFVLEMHKAATQTDKTIAILSQNYLDAVFTQPEWSAALVQDPTGDCRKLIPIRVEPCQPQGLLASIVYADLVGLGEDASRIKLLTVAQGDRPKPNHVAFPACQTAKKDYPGEQKPGFPLNRRSPERDPHSGTATQGPSTRADRKGFQNWPPFLWFVFALSCAAALISYGSRLVEFGLVNQIYYIVLVALGLGAASALFAGFRSVAKYRGRSSWGTLELGGPPVVFCLVVGLGMHFSPGNGTFGLTVFVHGPSGPQDLVLRDEGRVAIDLGPDRRSEQIGEKGSAFFPAIPAEYRGKEVPVFVLADGFVQTDTSTLRLTGNSLYVSVAKEEARFSGRIIDDAGDPVPGALVDVAGHSANTDPAGKFELSIPGTRVKDEMTLDVQAKGFKSQTHRVVPNSSEIRLRLEGSTKR